MHWKKTRLYQTYIVLYKQVCLLNFCVFIQILKVYHIHESPLSRSFLCKQGEAMPVHQDRFPDNRHIR